MPFPRFRPVIPSTGPISFKDFSYQACQGTASDSLATYVPERMQIGNVRFTNFLRQGYISDPVSWSDFRGKEFKHTLTLNYIPVHTSSFNFDHIGAEFVIDVTSKSREAKDSMIHDPDFDIDLTIKGGWQGSSTNEPALSIKDGKGGTVTLLAQSLLAGRGGSANSDGGPALYIGNATLVNYGQIYGGGGGGGSANFKAPGSNGGDGGTAIIKASGVTIQDSGIILGGGSGGGAGGVGIEAYLKGFNGSPGGGGAPFGEGGNGAPYYKWDNYKFPATANAANGNVNKGGDGGTDSGCEGGDGGSVGGIGGAGKVVNQVDGNKPGTWGTKGSSIISG